MPTLNVRPVRSAATWEAARYIRRRVFIDEQECPPAEEWDAHDATSRHLLGWLGDAPIAVARWRAVPHDDLIVAKLERFAVLPAFRGAGHGRTLVRATEADAHQAGFDAFLLHAQAHLEAFYASMGYTRTRDDVFMEAGIPHVEMLKAPDPPAHPAAASPPEANGAS